MQHMLILVVILTTYLSSTGLEANAYKLEYSCHPSAVLKGQQEKSWRFISIYSQNIIDVPTGKAVTKYFATSADYDLERDTLYNITYEDEPIHVVDKSEYGKDLALVYESRYDSPRYKNPKIRLNIYKSTSLSQNSPDQPIFHQADFSLWKIGFGKHQLHGDNYLCRSDGFWL